MTSTVAAPGPVRALRARIRIVAWVVVVGLGLELAVTRHWDGAIQLVAWAALGVTAAGLALIGLPRRPAQLAARALLAAVGAMTLFGVWEHLESNYHSGPLDRRYAATWASLSVARRWWLAASGGVGPAPPLVPGALALVAVLGLLSAAPPDADAPAGGPTAHIGRWGASRARS